MASALHPQGLDPFWLVLPACLQPSPEVLKTVLHFCQALGSPHSFTEGFCSQTPGRCFWKTVLHFAIGALSHKVLSEPLLTWLVTQPLLATLPS